MSRIQQLLQGRHGFLDFDDLLGSFPWLTRRGMRCILSPDSDGLLCGLFMAHHFDWEIVGFYDGKVLVLEDGVSCFDDDVAFLDMEVYRRGVKSMGHHMLAYRYHSVPDDWDEQYTGCLNPHLVRGYDASVFRLKYPLANIHLLLAIIGSQEKIAIPPSAIPPLLFTDGAFNVLYRYPENVLNWLNYLGIDDDDSPLRAVFMQEHYTVYNLMIAMDEFFRRRDEISVSGERGDRLRISTTAGEPFNTVEQENGLFHLNNEAHERVELFLNLLAETTRWQYRPDRWHFSDWRVYAFTKSDFTARKWSVTIANFKKMMELKPLSWAMTSGNNIEFTIEEPRRLP